MDTYNVVVGAVVMHDDQVLLLQRSVKEKFLPGAWGIPAGKASYGEPLEDAVLRELKEETGLTGTISKMTGSTWFLSEVDGELLRNLQVNFLIECDSRQVRLDPSSDDHRWISRDDLDDVEVDDFTRGVLCRALPGIDESTGSRSDEVFPIR